MEKDKKKENLQSRREFFKKTTKEVLPFLGIMTLSSMFSACDPLIDDDSHSGCGKSCSGSCEGDCAGDCDDNCVLNCMNSCDRWTK